MAAFPHNHHQTMDSGQRGINPVAMMDSVERGMNPVTMTIINALERILAELGSNQQPPVLKSCTLLTELC